MLENFIRSIFLFITSIYTFYKLCNQRPANKFTQTILLIFSATVCYTTTFLFNVSHALNLIIIFLLFFLIMQVLEKPPITSTYITALFSFAFSFIVFSLSIIITSLPFSLALYQNYTLSWSIMRFIIGIVQFSFSYCFFVNFTLRFPPYLLVELPHNTKLQKIFKKERN